MKNLCLLLSIPLCLILQSAMSQMPIPRPLPIPGYSDPGYEKYDIYQTWVISNDNKPRIKGYLTELKSSSIVITRYNRFEIKESLVKINIQNVKTLKFRRKGRIGKSILHGAIAGFAFGGIIGLISGDDDPDAWFRLTAEEKAVIGGVALGLIGGSAGGIVGSFKINIPINGNQKTYENKKKKLSTYKY